MGKGVLSSCQPLEIPGNVIQSCSLKNHSARNPPGQQTQQCVVSGWKNKQQQQQKDQQKQTSVTVHSSVSPPAAHVPRAFPCATCAWFSSTPRLPVASYKNSFSMTEWRIRLEGSGLSSGTPFEKCWLRSVLLLPLYLFPSRGKKSPESSGACFLCC